MTTTKSSEALRNPRFAKAAKQAKEYVASIADDPMACPMFPPVNEYSIAAEMMSYVQGYLAGLIASTGPRPTRAEMKEIRHDVMHDPTVRDLFVRTQINAKKVPLYPASDEF